MSPSQHTKLLLVLLGLLWSVPAAAQQPRLTLEEAIETALEHNHAVRAARNEVEIAENDYSLGHAGFFPSVNLNVQQSRSTLGSFSRDGAGNPAFGAANTFDVGVNMDATIFDGFGRLVTYQRLETYREQADIQRRRVAEDVVARVIDAYYNLVHLQQQIEVLRETVDISEERLRIAELRQELGVASELDVRRARVDLNADRASLLRQEVTLTSAKAAFNELLAREDGEDFQVADRIDLNTDVDVNQVRALALQQNTSLRLAGRRQEVAELSRREVRAEWMPRISLRAGYGLNDLTQQAGLPVSRPGGFTYGITASVNLFDGFERRRRYENATLRVRNSELAIEETRLQVSTDLKNAAREYENRLQLIALEAENVEMAESNVEVALERFRQGTITAVELREVQRALAGAESRMITARYEAKRAETRLLQLSGSLLNR